MEVHQNKDLIAGSTSLVEGNRVEELVPANRALEGKHTTGEYPYKDTVNNFEAHLASDIQQSSPSMTRQEVLQRRINFIEELISEYKKQSKHLRDELLLQHCSSDTLRGERLSNQAVGNEIDENDGSLDDASLNTLWGGVVPHALEVEVKALRAAQYQGNICYKRLEGRIRESQQCFLENGLLSVARQESSSHSSWCQEMDKHDAIAMICGENYSYFVRSRSISLGRRVAEGKKEKHGESIDIDLGEEAFGHLGAISRCQARVLFDVDAKFRIKNVGQRLIFVDGKAVEPGQMASLCHLSLISIATVSLLFAVNQRAVDRIDRA